MAFTDFAYISASDASNSTTSVTILADRECRRAEWCEDADLTGLRIEHFDTLDAICEGPVLPLGDVVVVDCHDANAQALSALCRIDQRVARSGAELVVAIGEESMDAAFGCLDQSRPRWLVAAERKRRIVELVSLMARKPQSRLQELSEDDREALARLTEQVGQIAERLDSLGQRGLGKEGGAFHFESPRSGARHSDSGTEVMARQSRPPLPDPRLIRTILAQRQSRARFFGSELFADPAWDILLDLTAARAEHQRVSVTSLCIASSVPPTTALRWIGRMVECGLLERVEDDTDKRRAFIRLSDSAADAMARYFAEIDTSALLIS